MKKSFDSLDISTPGNHSSCRNRTVWICQYRRHESLERTRLRSSDSRVAIKKKMFEPDNSCRRNMQQTGSLGISYLDISLLRPRSQSSTPSDFHIRLLQNGRNQVSFKARIANLVRLLCLSCFGRGCSTGNYPTCFSIPMKFLSCGSPHCASTAFRQISK